MRKSIITVSLLAVIISFSACVTVDAASQKVMNDIDSIGEVELSDKALIEKIEYTYSTLTEKQKEQVKNYVVLLNARDEYDRLVAEQAKQWYSIISDESIRPEEEPTETIPVDENGIVQYDIPQDDDFDYQYDAALGGIIIYGYKGNSKAIKIPDEINGEPVLILTRKEVSKDQPYGREPETRWEPTSQYPKYLLIPDNVTIEQGIFASTGLISINIPSCMTSIGEGEFAGCQSLRYITIPNNVTIINRGAFSGCTHLESIEIPNSVTKIGVNAFNGCSNLKNAKLPDCITEIGKGAFYDCSNLEEIILPASLEIIDEKTFMNCQNLKKVIVPENIKLINFYAFANCENLEEINIPDNGEAIYDKAFSYCSKLKNLELPDSVYVYKAAFYESKALTVKYKGKEYNYSNFDDLYSSYKAN